MSWSYNPQTRRTDDSEGLIARTQIEEAADQLVKAGITSRPLLIRILCALSGLGKGEVGFNVDFVLKEGGEKHSDRFAGR